MNSGLDAQASDIKSAIALGATAATLSDLYSDFQSRVPKTVATNSQLSDLISDLASEVKSAITAGTSDVKSAITVLDALSDRIAVACIGNVTGAGTGTEAFAYGGVTATVTVDSSGNRTLVFS